MQYIVLNRNEGTFGLSRQAYNNLENMGFKLHEIDYRDVMFRANTAFVDLVLNMGQDVNASYSNLQVIEIPDDVDLSNTYINNNYGYETLRECGRVW